MADADDDGANDLTDGTPDTHPRGGDNEGDDRSGIADLNQDCGDPTLQDGDGNGPLHPWSSTASAPRRSWSTTVATSVSAAIRTEWQ